MIQILYGFFVFTGIIVTALLLLYILGLIKLAIMYKAFYFSDIKFCIRESYIILFWIVIIIAILGISYAIGTAL